MTGKPMKAKVATQYADVCHPKPISSPEMSRVLTDWQRSNFHIFHQEVNDGNGG